ncbi:MAG: dihydropteroate synthase [Balneolales bacterium]
MKHPDYSTPMVMGVLNVTPDSFSDGGTYINSDTACHRVEAMICEGASIIDIGGESTSPGSDLITKKEELERVTPVLKAVVSRFPDTFFSIDTTKYEVGKAALDHGVHIVNDVSGLQKEPGLAKLCAEYDATLVIMHSQGNPKTMQKSPFYKDVVQEVNAFFAKQAAQAQQDGCKKIVLDPGIGFGKKLHHNITLLANLDKFHVHGLPLMIGASRKASIGQILNDRAVEGRLAGTLAVHYDAMIKGCKIIRVHDVKEAFDTILIYNAIHSLNN